MSAVYLKWAGSKRILSPNIEMAFDEIAGSGPWIWREPFCGSIAAFFYLQAKGRIQRAVLSDQNVALIAAHRAVKERLRELWVELDQLPCGEGWRLQFSALRAEFNQRKVEAEAEDDVRLAALFCWLNRAAFNGLYRENAKELFNVPPGSYATVRLPPESDLVLARDALVHAEVHVQSCWTAIRAAGPEDCLYLDPPYVPASSTASFESYLAGGFGKSAQALLAKEAGEARRRGVHVVASNHDTPWIREIWSEGFRIQPVEVARSISAKGATRGVAQEVLLIGDRA